MIPNVPLHNGITIPQVGFGTMAMPPIWEETAENTARTAAIVTAALDEGYRHFDTAQMYGNERGVGEAIASSGLPRGQVFVTSKLDNGNHGPDDVRRTFAATLNRLGIAQLDLFLMHWPLPTLYGGDYVSTWRAMIELVVAGRVRAIGVSNFQPEHLERIIGETGVVPVVNQIEVHPYFRNDAARQASARHGIAVEAWSPLGQGRVLGDETLARIARAHGRSVAQIILRWHVQHGSIVIPLSSKKERMRENRELFDFELSGTEMALIDRLDEGEDGRTGPHPDTFALIRAHG